MTSALTVFDWLGKRLVCFYLKIAKVVKYDLLTAAEPDLDERIIPMCTWHDGMNTTGFADPPTVYVRVIRGLIFQAQHHNGTTDEYARAFFHATSFLKWFGRAPRN